MIDASVKSHIGQFQLAAEVRGTGVTCIVGRNGAGKTTLLRTLAGFLKIDEGHVLVGGVDVTRAPVEKRGVVLVTPESFFSHMDVDAHMIWGRKLSGRPTREVEVLSIRSKLGIDFRGPVGKLSLGMRERVSLATALLAAPKVILVDEAFASLHDREAFVAAYGRILAESHVDLIFTSQDLADGKLADNVYMIKAGVTTAIN
ncbi:MAG TPA: ATP-binding cassette domain-containing protein [Nitrososphaerales archaeon]|nr:ATP-binding cassette domain-containing protein [Nitrososphaerales archaeon]